MRLPDLQGAAVRALALLGAAALLFAAGMWLGHDLAEQQWAKQSLAAERKARDEFSAEVARGEAAGAALREQLQAQGRYVSTLNERLRDGIPLVALAAGHAARPVGAVQLPDAAAGPAVPGVAGADAGAGCGAAAAGDGGGCGVALGGAAVPVEPAAGGDGGGAGGVVLTAGAVSLWNSALAQQDIDVGACRAADPAGAACAAATAVDLDDAWANHIANAASCAADRARQQRLIDWVMQQMQRSAQP